MLTRLECLEIMELGAKANINEIETRYTMLIKRYHGRTDPETAEALDRITMAYNILTGRYIEPEPVNPRLEKVVWGKSLKQWSNLWHYGRWPLLFAAIGLAFVIYFIFSVVTSKKPDFQIYVTGLFFTTEDAEPRFGDYLRTILPEAETVEYAILPIDMRGTVQTESTATGETSVETSGETTAETTSGYSPDYENQYAYVMKLTTMFAAESIEVYICDDPLYTQYAPQGVYANLDALYARLQDLPPDILAKIKPLRRYSADNSASPDLNATPTPINVDKANQDTTLPITGLDVTELHLAEGLGIYGDSQVLTIGARATDLAKTELFLEAWIRDYEKMHDMQKAYEDALKATITPEPTDTATQPTAD